MIISKDYKDENGCFNLIIEFKHPDRLNQIEEWCQNNISSKDCATTNLYTSAKILKLVCTFLREADADYVRSLVSGKKPDVKRSLKG
jgi:hypothetical protein